MILHKSKYKNRYAKKYFIFQYFSIKKEKLLFPPEISTGEKLKKNFRFHQKDLHLQESYK